MVALWFDRMRCFCQRLVISSGFCVDRAENPIGIGHCFCFEFDIGCLARKCLSVDGSIWMRRLLSSENWRRWAKTKFFACRRLDVVAQWQVLCAPGDWRRYTKIKFFCRGIDVVMQSMFSSIREHVTMPTTIWRRANQNIPDARQAAPQALPAVQPRSENPRRHPCREVIKGIQFARQVRRCASYTWKVGRFGFAARKTPWRCACSVSGHFWRVKSGRL